MRFGPEKDGRLRHGAEAAAAVRNTKRHRPSPHPRETLVEGEAGDLIPSFPFAEAGFGGRAGNEGGELLRSLLCNYGLVRSLPGRFYT